MRLSKPVLFLISSLLISSYFNGYAQPDTVLTLQQAKTVLLKKNFFLLAAYYQIGQSEARLIQARVWNNPTLVWNQEAYNMEENKYLRTHNQFETQISQVISIAGKHTNTVKLARINVELNRVQFQDVIRSLLFELNKVYNDLAAVEEKAKLYSQVLNSYQRLLAASEKELQVGAISVTEDLRIKSEYIAVKAQALDNGNQKEQALAQLRTLLQFPSDTVVHVQQKIPLFNTNFILDSLISRSLSMRPDLKAARVYKEYQNQNLRLQKSLSIPDVTIGYDYDKGGNYIKQYSGLLLQVPLPVFDRNQGRIKEAQYTIKQSEFQLEYLKINVINQVIAAYNQYKRNNEGLSSYSDEFLVKLDQLNRNTNIYFQKRDITLLEFIDQQRIYITTNIQLIELKQQYLNSVNNLNFSVGETVVDY
jgi:cobalt-zinc-cadmium efflux system outer membrane protein